MHYKGYNCNLVIRLNQSILFEHKIIITANTQVHMHVQNNKIPIQSTSEYLFSHVVNQWYPCLPPDLYSCSDICSKSECDASHRER